MKLEYNLYSFSQLEKVGVNITDYADDDSASVGVLLKIVWAGLICKFPDTTVKEVGKAYGTEDIAKLIAAISSALNKR